MHKDAGHVKGSIEDVALCGACVTLDVSMAVPQLSYGHKFDKMINKLFTKDMKQM